MSFEFVLEDCQVCRIVHGFLIGILLFLRGEEWERAVIKWYRMLAKFAHLPLKYCDSSTINMAGSFGRDNFCTAAEISRCHSHLEHGLRYFCIHTHTYTYIDSIVSFNTYIYIYIYSIIYICHGDL